jgi:hypothetical protein
MSLAGKETMIKSVLHFSKQKWPIAWDVLIYLTNPEQEDVYYGGGCLNKKFMHRLARNKIVVPKGQSRMGCRDMATFNITLLGKPGWRLLTSSNSLCARVFRVHYCRNKGFMEATTPKTAPQTWQEESSIG